MCCSPRRHTLRHLACDQHDSIRCTNVVVTSCLPTRCMTWLTGPCVCSHTIADISSRVNGEVHGKAPCYHCGQGTHSLQLLSMISTVYRHRLHPLQQSCNCEGMRIHRNVGGFIAEVNREAVNRRTSVRRRPRPCHCSRIARGPSKAWQYRSRRNNHRHGHGRFSADNGSAILTRCAHCDRRRYCDSVGTRYGRNINGAWSSPA